MYIIWLVVACIVIYAVGQLIAAREKGRVTASDEPMTLTPNEHGVFTLQQSRATRLLSIRARIVLSFGAIALFCIVMAYVTGKPDVVGGCTWGLGASGCQYANHSSPNIIWFFFAFWPGVIAAATAYLSWVFTGRAW